MNVEQSSLPEVLLLTPKRIGDHRGYFCEAWREDQIAAALGPDIRFVQDNESFSSRRGTLRGLHYQMPPTPQGKLVRVLTGAVLDVVVDVRHGSPTFGRHVAVELSADNALQIWVPPGFAHGFCALTDDVRMLYKVTSYFSAPLDKSVAWNDPDIAIAWPSFPEGHVLSARDEAAPRLKDVDTGFRFAPA
jgi:dTDP-4-dehydrorhamnose 3,5-epimerase